MVIVAFKPPLIKLKGRKAGMSNHHLRNKELTLKAKGLLSQTLSLPEDWDYTLKGLSLINREKIDAIREAIKELERAGYIVRSRGATRKDAFDKQISNMKKRLSAIVKEYKFDFVQAFYKELNAAEKEQIVKEREAGRDSQARKIKGRGSKEGVEILFENVEKSMDSKDYIVCLCPLIFHLRKVLLISRRTD